MTSFIVDESQLNRLSPSARTELLRILQEDLSELRAELHHADWAPDRNTSYPLTPAQAVELTRGVTHFGRSILRVFADEAGSGGGFASLAELLAATGRTRYETLGQDIAAITQTLRRLTGNNDAWLFNWRPEDWVWDEQNNTYKKGSYFISEAATRALREALKVAA